jgi:hypothetical protein
VRSFEAPFLLKRDGVFILFICPGQKDKMAEVKKGDDETWW